MATYTADKVFICSIFPGQLPDQKRNYGPSLNTVGKGAQRQTVFHLDPVPRGTKPCILTVYDSFEEVLDIAAISAAGGVKKYVPKPVPVQEIAADLVDKWTSGGVNVPSGAKPGVMVIANTSPTQAESAAMKLQQNLYFEWWFSQGEAVHRGDKQAVLDHGGQVPHLAILASEYLGRPRPWSNAGYSLETGPCPACTEIIPDSAVICPRCGKQIGHLGKNGNVERLTTAQLLASLPGLSQERVGA